MEAAYFLSTKILYNAQLIQKYIAAQFFYI